MSQKQSIFSVVYNRSGKVLSTGENSYKKTNPNQARIAALVGLPDKQYLHSEVASLLNLHHSHKPYSIFVSRKMRNGEWGMARPCNVCMQAIRTSGIKRIYFTNEEGQIQMEKVQ